MNTNGQDNKDFYMILPSNGCKHTHPENEANKFTISWEQPISLDDKWKVALTEANFSYTMTSINTSFGIRYDWWKTSKKRYRGRLVGDTAKRHVEFQFFNKLPDAPPADSTGLKPFPIPQVKYSSDTLNNLEIESTSPFEIHIIGAAGHEYMSSKIPFYRTYINADIFKNKDDI